MLTADNNKYYTNITNLAAAIISKGVTLVDFQSTNNVITFIFDYPMMCKEYEKLWFTNELEVKAQEYAQALRQLKGIIKAIDK